MATAKYALLSLFVLVAFASCTKLDPSCVHGTWRDTTSLDSVFYNEIVFNDDGSGGLNSHSEGCTDHAFRKNSVFNWTENEGVLTLSYFDTIRNNCFGVDEHTDSVYTIAYSCSEAGLWMAGVTWDKQ
ncbi:MAG: hypothetical protein ACI9FU_001435 [Granulosicoccus sp.]|jgi:hypothetical protein